MKTLFALSLIATLLAAQPPKFPEPYDSEKPKEKIMSAEAAAAGFKVPAGFRVEVFASEPDVRNPIACCWDTKGRFWVAENYTYAEREKKFDLNLKDRVIIFHDKDGDGKPDERKVFIDTVQRLTSVEVGLGGVWLMCPPQLLFVPDANGDDIPDGPPQVVLEGFDVPAENYHNFANGLKWGPDGWLYGRCGASAPGNVRRPDQGPQDAVPLAGGIWRYHPKRKVFEALCHGTTNPWGHDWNELGECFFINTVNGHLWHMIPGAHYRRPHTITPNPLVYEPMEMIADHWHFDTAAGWNQKAVNDSRNTTPLVDKLGGGHAHIGCMIYNGDNWPKEYRGKLFTLNMHGRRINVESLHRQGSSYVGKHEPDICFAADPMFRGMELSQAPDGSVYVLDWHDAGECHEHNGVIRSTGRIYRIRYLDSPRPAHPDLTQWSGQQLAEAHKSTNQWLVRMARRELLDRAATGKKLTHAIEILNNLDDVNELPLALNARQTLFAMGAIDDDKLKKEYLANLDPTLASWAIRAYTDDWPLDTATGKPRVTAADWDDEVLKHLLKLAGDDMTPSSVRLTLASLLQRLPLQDRTTLALELLKHDDHTDPQLPLMIWYGLIPVALQSPEKLVPLAVESKTFQVRHWISRRFAEIIAEKPECLDMLLEQTAKAEEFVRCAVVIGMSEGLVGIRKAKMPTAWKGYTNGIMNGAVIGKVQMIDIVFGDGQALDAVKAIALDGKADLEQRKAALRSVIEANPPDLKSLCEKLINTRFLNSVAVKGLAAFDDAGPVILKAYNSFHPSERGTFFDVMSSRPAFAMLLLDEIGKGRFPAAMLSAGQARTIRGFNKPEITSKLTAVWGEFRDSPKDKADLITKLKNELTGEILSKADAKAGRAIFAKNCASCHKLYGEGESVGPDLTGAGRKDMDYLTSNIVDPSAVVTKDFQMTKYELKDGRVLNGIKMAESPQAITIQLEKEKVTVPKADIESQKQSTMSLMPDGLLQNLKPEEIRNLFAYLQTSSQVPLP